MPRTSGAGAVTTHRDPIDTSSGAEAKRLEVDVFDKENTIWGGYRDRYGEEPFTTTQATNCHLLNGSSIRCSTDKMTNCINPWSFNGNRYISTAPGYTFALPQGASTDTYGFNKEPFIGMSTERYVEFASDMSASVSLMEVNMTNMTTDRLNYFEQPVKIYAISAPYTVPDPIFYPPPAANVTDISYANRYPISYEDFAGGGRSPEANALDTKFGWDYATMPLESYDYAYESIIANIGTIAEDLRSGVLSRFDLTKTTNPMQINKQTFEKITADEGAEGQFSITARDYVSPEEIERARNALESALDMSSTTGGGDTGPMGPGGGGGGGGMGGGGGAPTGGGGY